MALSFLAKCYSIEKNKKCYFFIVDHKLRKNSTIEANLVKKKLKSFNYKFTTNRIDELENEPAYKRAQVDMNNDNSLSRLSVETDSSNETRIRTNNSFLHDNVD